MKNRDALTAAFRAFGTAKELALAGGISPITAYRYQNALTKPDLDVVTRLMGKSRAILDAVLHAAGCDDVAIDLEIDRITRLLADLQEQRAQIYADLDAAKATPRGMARPAVPMADAAEAQRGLK